MTKTSAELSPDLSRMLEQAVVQGQVAPGAAAAAAYRDDGVWRLAIGVAGRLLATRPEYVKATTVYDLASLTKPIMACVALRLAAHLESGLATPLGELLPSVRGTPAADAPIELVLAHRAGLHAHLELYAPLVDGGRFERGAALITAANARRSECVGDLPEKGFPPVYSDLGYILVGEALAAHFRADLDALVQREVNEPLDLRLGSARRWTERTAALAPHERFSEIVAPTEDVAWRGGQVRGVVHDENAWALNGTAASGHAGLFATVIDVAGFGVALIDALERRDNWLEAEQLQRLIAPRPGGTLRAGFDGKSSEGSAAGRLFGADAFGHLGFTGTSLWCDPHSEIVGVLLTNRVSLGRDHGEIRKARPLIHDNLYRYAKARRAKTPPR